MKESILRLFKAIEVKTKERKENNNILKQTIQKGFILSPEIISNYSEKELQEIIKSVDDEYGLNSERINTSLHKSWKKVKDTPIEILIIEQICHYITTYGYEYLGIYDSESVFIPIEALDIPEINETEIKLVIIKAYTKEEIKEKLLKLLNTGIALKDKTVNDVVNIALYVELSEDEIFNIKNKETKIVLYDYLNIFPKNNVEFLRYLIYKATEEKLLIKNKTLIEKIKARQNVNVVGLLERYNKKYGYEKLAEIFNRYKPIWLAFRTNSKLKQIVNKLRRLSDKYHKPMKVDYLNNVTNLIRNGKSFDYEKLKIELENVNIFRKLRLLYALKYRTKEVNSLFIQVRNGKGWSKEYNCDNNYEYFKVYTFILQDIINNIKEKVENKKIFIPNYLKYALPLTEKQFIGNIPCGTYIELEKDMIVGVNWNNVKGHRIDLDLSLVSNGSKIGWNGRYRSNGILFSGDMTDASTGASELFYIPFDSPNDNYLMYLNFFNYEDIEVPYNIIVAKEEVNNFEKNYPVNPNNVLANIKTSLNKRQGLVGYLSVDELGSKFYFSDISLGKTNISGNNEYSQYARDYLNNFYKNIITLNEILEKAGAIIVDNKEEVDIDLSLENIERDTIIDLIS